MMPWLLLLLLAGVAVLIPTAYAGKIGAPYAPTRIAVVRRAFNMLEVGEDDVLVDLGAGDGKIVLEAAHRGARAIGYELSPIMWFVSWLRTQIPPRRWNLGSLRRQRWQEPVVRFGNFYKKKLPQDTTVIFAFLMPYSMAGLKEYLVSQRLPNAKVLLSYAFPLKDEESLTVVREKKCAPLYVYDLQELKSQKPKRKTATQN